MLDANKLTREESLELVRHLRDFTYLQEDMDFQTIAFNSDVIGSEEAIEIAKYLKDAKVSHIINLDHVKIGEAGIEALHIMLLTARISPLISGYLHKRSNAKLCT